MTRVTQAHIDARTADILSAATRLFARRGIEATTMQEIAAEAGLSAGAIYRYFASKDELLAAVFADCTQQKREWFRAAVAGEDSPLQAFLMLGRHAWDELKEHAPEHLILGLETSLAASRRPQSVPKEYREGEAATIDMMEALLREAQAAGEIDAAVDARGLALTAQACHVGCHVLALDLGPEANLDPVFDILAELLRRLSPERQPALSGEGGTHDESCDY